MDGEAWQPTVHGVAKNRTRLSSLTYLQAKPGGTEVMNLPANAGVQVPRELGKSLSRKWKPAPVFLLGKFHAQRSLEGYSPQSHKESDMTEYTPIGIINKIEVACISEVVQRPAKLVKVKWKRKNRIIGFIYYRQSDMQAVLTLHSIMLTEICAYKHCDLNLQSNYYHRTMQRKTRF